MTRQLLNLPINVPWKLIAVSPDMMDTRFCNKLFPFAWRSSLAISAYEPRPEDLPEDLCEGRITYLKITCTVTGYQPSREETRDITTILEEFGDTPTEDLRDEIDRITQEYFACYGALLNVAVFPNPKTRTELIPITKSFANQNPGASLPNPLTFESEGMSFLADDRPSNRVIDLVGTGASQLDLHETMTVTLTPTPRVIAKIVHRSPEPVSMHVFRGTEPVGSQTTGPEHGVAHELSIDGEAIDRVVFKAPGNQAGLIEFTRFDTREVDLELGDYPHIIDFEPKVRDLYQAATEAGEILTSSHSNVTTNKSFMSLDSTETGFKVGATIPVGTIPVSAEFSRKRTNTEQDNWAVQTDASRERRETEGTSTQLSQMYNLLTGYHPCTNRAVEFMLARPHVLQPTDFRTFVQGLRAIEGVQEFFLIVARPEYVDGLCVEAFLETGHFPEDTTLEQTPEQFEESHEDFTVQAHITLDNDSIRIEADNPTAIYKIDSGWVIDRRESRKRKPGDPAVAGWTSLHAGMSEITRSTDDNASLSGYDYRAIDAVTAQVFGVLHRNDAAFRLFERTYRVFTRSEKPIRPRGQPRVDLNRLLITSRGLCACFSSGEECPEIVPPPEPPVIPRGVAEVSIVDEPMIRLRSALLVPSVSAQTLPVIKDLLAQVQVAMATSWRQPRRYPLGKFGFLESEYLKERLRKVLPEEYLAKALNQVPGLPRGLLQGLGESATISEALELDLSALARKTGLDIAEAATVRRRLLRITKREDEREGESPYRDK